MRGYAKLKERGQSARVEDLLHALAITELSVGNGVRSSFFGSALPIAEKVVRQYLLLHLGGIDLRMKLLSVLGKPDSVLVHPLPNAWMQTLVKEGINVSGIRSRLLWQLYLFGTVVYAMAAMCKSLILSLRRPNTSFLQNSAYFDGVSTAQLPRNEEPSFDLFSWYVSQKKDDSKISSLTHSVKAGTFKTIKGLPLNYVCQPQPLPRTWKTRLALCKLYIELSVLSVVDAIRGRWWHALLLREAERAALINVAAREHLAKEYLFSNSGWLYRPLWTYAAEKAGSGISFYFYSTNAAAFKTRHGYPRQTNHWELCTWSRYLVWGDGQEAFLHRLGLSGEIQQVGPIWFSDTDAKLPLTSRPAMAVFDVQPMRESIYRSLALGFEYYTAATAIQFAEEVTEVAGALNLSILWKRKRDIGTNVHPLYVRKMERLEKNGSIIAVEPGLAAQHIIEQACCVVSMPFTSTALLARSMKKPSCYYDPTGLIQPDDRSADGIDVMTSPETLRDWIASNLVL